MSLQHENLTYKLRGGLFLVQNEVGLGRSEEAYHRAFCHWMTENDISFQSKPVYPVTLDGRCVLDLIPDLVVEECLVIELKAKPQHLAKQDSLQLYNYLKRTGISLGLLCNLGLDRVQIDRHLYDRKPTEYQRHGAAPESGTTNMKIHEMLSALYSEHQTGYGSAIMDRILSAALTTKGISVKRNPSVLSHYKNNSLGSSSLACLILNDDMVFCHTCLFDDNAFNCSRAVSFMQALSLKYAVAVNFGKRILEARFFA